VLGDIPAFETEVDFVDAVAMLEDCVGEVEELEVDVVDDTFDGVLGPFAVMLM
jgi:hypothetical protein